MTPPRPLDALDIDLLLLLMRRPKAGVREYSRRLNIARGTATSRLDRLTDAGVIRTHAPTLEPAELGYPLSADLHITAEQRRLDGIVGALEQVPFVLRADSLAGREDLSCRIAAADVGHLEKITDRVLAIPGVLRVRTDVVLRRRIPHRITPLLDEARRRIAKE